MGWKGLIFGGVVDAGKMSLKQKKPSDDANIVIPMPVTCCDAPKYIVNTACSRPKIPPITRAANIPVYRSAQRYTVIHPTIAPIDIMPSMPRFKTPARSHNTSPIVASIKGQAILIVAAQNPAVKIISINSIIFFSSEKQYSVVNKHKA